MKIGDSKAVKPAKSKLSVLVSTSLLVLTLQLIPLPQPGLASRSQTANPSIDNIAAATSAARTHTAEEVAPIAEPPERSTDKGFSTEDFLQDTVTKTGKRSSQATEVPAQVNLRVRVSVPQNTDLVERFVAYPYPMPLPVPKRPPGYKTSGTADKPTIPKQAYDRMPATRRSIRDMVMQTGYTNRMKRSMAYPDGGWRWQMAYRNALQRCKKSEPTIITELYPFLDAMEPLVKDECKRFDDLEEERQRRYEQAYEEYQLNRNEIEYNAVKKGYFPVEFQMNKYWRGHPTSAEIRLNPGTWWITGTHKVAGLTYYWQQPVQVVAGHVETLDLDWLNALVIEGGW